MTRSHLRHGTGPHLSTSPKKKEAELGWDWPWPRAKGGSFVWIPVLHSSQDSVPLRPLRFLDTDVRAGEASGSLKRPLDPPPVLGQLSRPGFLRAGSQRPETA